MAGGSAGRTRECRTSGQRGDLFWLRTCPPFGASRDPLQLAALRARFGIRARAGAIPFGEFVLTASSAQRGQGLWQLLRASASSTRPANHYRHKPAGDSAGQLSNRVFERHHEKVDICTHQASPMTEVLLSACLPFPGLAGCVTGGSTHDCQ